MATPVQFAEYVRLRTRTNSTTFTDADIIIFMRQRQDELAKDILKADEKILLIPQTSDLVASGTTREYPMPSDILSRLRRVEAKLDGTNWVKLWEKDETMLDYALTESNITANFTNSEGEAYYFIRRKALYLLSGTVIASTDGLAMWCNTWPTAVTDLTSVIDMSVDPSTTTHGIPRELHEIWMRGVIIDYKQSKEKAIPLSERELKYEVDKREAVQSLRNTNEEREVIGELPPASDRYNDGQDL